MSGKYRAVYDVRFHWRRLEKIFGVKPKYWGKKVALTDKSIAFLNYWGHAPCRLHPKSTPMYSSKQKHTDEDEHRHMPVALICAVLWSSFRC